MKKVLSVLLSIALMLAILPTGIFTITASAATSGYYTYTVSGGKATITSCDTSISGSITIPATLGGYPVTSIGDWAFYGCSSLTSITIPNSVKSIGDYTFYCCDSLTSIIIPSSVTSIGEGAFCWCSNLMCINVDENNKNYCSQDGVLFNKEKTILICYPCGKVGATYIVPNSVTSIGDWAFVWCSSLTSITIPESVTSIGNNAFEYCDRLTNVYYRGSYGQKNNISISLYNDELTSATWYCNSCVGKAEHTYDSDNDICNVCGDARDATDYSFLTYTVSNGEVTIDYCDNSIRGDITIPAILDGYPVTSIGDWAFYGCSSLTSITIPNSVKSIGEYAFYYCTSLTSITIPNGVTSIEKNVFFSCFSLTNVTIPNSVTSIGDLAFSWCGSLTSITISENVTSIGEGAFYGCVVTDIYYRGSYGQKNNISIGLYNDELTSATWYCNSCVGKAEHTYDSDNDICNVCGCTRETTDYSFLTYTVSNGEVVIDCCDTSIRGDITIPAILDGYPVTRIGDYAFNFCSELTSITIGENVASIGEQAFSDCMSLTSIIVDENNENYSSQDGVLFNKEKTILLRYPSDKTITTYTIPNGVTSIANYAFLYCDSLISVIIPNSTTSIGKSAFDCCSNLTSITMPNSVTNIGSNAFYCCQSLTRITISNKVESIGDGTFFGCLNLTSITVPKSITSIGDYAFADCHALANVYYSGSQGERKNISIGTENTKLASATWHYNTIPTYESGDINGDAEVNVVDLALLKKMVAGLSESLDVDLNNDGETNVVDLAILKKIVAGLA